MPKLTECPAKRSKSVATLDKSKILSDAVIKQKLTHPVSSVKCGYKSAPMQAGHLSVTESTKRAKKGLKGYYVTCAEGPLQPLEICG